MTPPHERRLFRPPDKAIVPERLRVPTEWIVITGAPSSGKTTIVNRLASLLPGFTVVPEIATQLILEDRAANKTPDMSPEYNRTLSQRINVRRTQIETGLAPSTSTLMDRGAFDPRAYNRYYKIPEDDFVSDKLYKGVFLMDPLPFKPDSTRYEDPDQDPDFITKIDRLLYDVYAEEGYHPIRVPEASIDQRTRFILEHIEVFSFQN